MKQSRRKRGRPITKMALYLRAMRVSLWLTIPFGVLILLMALSGDANVQPGLQAMLRFVGGTTLAFFLCMILILSPPILLDLRRIKKQETHYGFRFNGEMKKHDIRAFVHMDANWLVCVSGCRIYAYRKGFLGDFGLQRRSLLGKKLAAKVMVACADGKVRIIAGNLATLTAIETWAQNPYK